MSAGDEWAFFVPAADWDPGTKKTPAGYLTGSAKDYRFLSSNQERRIHHQTRAKIARAWRHAAKEAACLQAPGLVLNRARIVVRFVKDDNRSYDPGNLYPIAKPIVDGLVDARILEDDDHTRLIGPDPRHGGNDTKRPGVWVRIIDMEGARHD